MKLKKRKGKQKIKKYTNIINYYFSFKVPSQKPLPNLPPKVPSQISLLKYNPIIFINFHFPFSRFHIPNY